MFKLKDLKNAHTPVIPQTPHFFWDEVLQNNLRVNGVVGDFNVIEDTKVMRNIIQHALMLEEYREKIKRGINITSWYRPAKYNDIVLIRLGYRSSRTSDHKCINACATDTNVPVANFHIEAWKRICRKYKVSYSIGLYKWGLHLGWRRDVKTRIWDWR